MLERDYFRLIDSSRSLLRLDKLDKIEYIQDVAVRSKSLAGPMVKALDFESSDCRFESGVRLFVGHPFLQS